MSEAGEPAAARKRDVLRRVIFFALGVLASPIYHVGASGFFAPSVHGVPYFILFVIPPIALAAFLWKGTVSLRPLGAGLATGTSLYGATIILFYATWN